MVEAKRGNRHHIVVENIGVITWGHAAHIDFTLEEAVIDLRITSVNKDIVVVTKSLGAVHVENDVAISVLEKVTLRLLKVDKLHGLIAEKGKGVRRA